MSANMRGGSSRDVSFCPAALGHAKSEPQDHMPSYPSNQRPQRHSPYPSVQAPNKHFPVAPPAFPLHIGTNGANLQDLLDYATAVEDERNAEKTFMETRVQRSHLESKLFQGQVPGAMKHLERACCGTNNVTVMIEDLGMEVNIPQSLIPADSRAKSQLVYRGGSDSGEDSPYNDE